MRERRKRAELRGERVNVRPIDGARAGLSGACDSRQPIDGAPCGCRVRPWSPCAGRLAGLRVLTYPAGLRVASRQARACARRGDACD